MREKLVISCALALLAVLMLPSAFAADGPPNLDNAAVCGEDGQTRWFLDARFFETGTDDEDWDNATYSIGFQAPINYHTDFILGYSAMDAVGPNPINGAIRKSDRDVLTAALKRRISGENSNPTWALTIGADVEAGGETKGMNTALGASAYQKTVTPAAKLQVEFGDPGRFQFQVAGQVAWWDTMLPCDNGTVIEGYGTVVGVGGGVVWPFSSRLSLTGDAMVIVDGENAVMADNTLDDEVVWSAGGTYRFGDANDTTLSVYATNSMSPTLAGSIIAASEDSLALGIALRRSL